MDERRVERAAAHRPTSPLDGSGPWRLESLFDPIGAMSTVPPGIEVTAAFAEQRMAGTTGCNRYSASVRLDGDRVELGPVATTMRACPDDRMALESMFLASLDRVRGFALGPTALELQDADGRVVLRFVADPPPGLEDVDWVAVGVNNGRGGVTSLVEGSTITARFTGGRVAGSGGCNRYTGSYEAADGSIRIGPLASTRMACLDEGIGEQETAYLAALERVRRFSFIDRRLELRDDDGALQASFRVAEPEATSGEG